MLGSREGGAAERVEPERMAHELGLQRRPRESAWVARRGRREGRAGGVSREEEVVEEAEPAESKARELMDDEREREARLEKAAKGPSQSAARAQGSRVGGNGAGHTRA